MPQTIGTNSNEHTEKQLFTMPQTIVSNSKEHTDAIISVFYKLNVAVNPIYETTGI